MDSSEEADGLIDSDKGADRRLGTSANEVVETGS